MRLRTRLTERFDLEHPIISAPMGINAIIAADGDATIKTSVIDLVRNYHWPDQFSGRALRNGFVAK